MGRSLRQVTRCLGLGMGLAIAGCAAQEPGLDGTWRLQSVDAAPVDAAAPEELPLFTISGTTIEGFDGCNQFSGPFDRPGAIAATRRACPELTTGLPLDLNALDAHFQSARIDGDQLIIPASGSFPASTYVREAGPGQ